MEQFKAVKRDLKTKAYSKEGLSAASRLDLKEKEKAESCDFLSNMVDDLQQRIESMEAEAQEEVVIQVSLEKGEKNVTKANRLVEISHGTERHKWHVNKLELLLRSPQNDNAVDVKRRRRVLKTSASLHSTKQEGKANNSGYLRVTLHPEHLTPQPRHQAILVTLGIASKSNRQPHRLRDHLVDPSYL
jgi:hypothetical protein